MISTENLTSSTVFTVSDTPSSVTEPFAAMKRASSRVVRSSNRAMSGRSSRATMVAMPSACPATMWPPSSSPIFSARSRLSRVPDAPMLRRGHGQRLGGGIDLEPGLALRHARRNHREADAIAGDRRAVGDGRLIVAAGDAQPVQLPLRRRRQSDDLADIGDNAGEHFYARS